MIDERCAKIGQGHVTNCKCSSNSNPRIAPKADRMGGIFLDIQKERERQEELKRIGKFHWTCASVEVSNPEKLAVLAEEFGEAAREVNELIIHKGETLVYLRMLKLKLRKELIETATVCVAWCEALDREERNSFSFPEDEQESLSSNLSNLTKGAK